MTADQYEAMLREIAGDVSAADVVMCLQAHPLDDTAAALEVKLHMLGDVIPHGELAGLLRGIADDLDAGALEPEQR